MKKILYIIFAMVMTISVVCCTAMVMPQVEIDINSPNGYLVDYNSGIVMYAKNENERKPIASMVKIMTLLLTFEAIDGGNVNIDEMVTISHEAASQTGSELFLDEGVQYSVSDLIKGTVVVSGNDSSVALAERVAGSVTAFTARMNERAKELGMNDTLFANCTGLPCDSEQYSSAKDVSLMTRELLKHKAYYNYSKIWLEDYTHPSGRVTQLANTNKLIRFYKGCDSGKTGYTDSARYCLSASSERDGMRIVGTLLGCSDSKSRFNDMTKLFNFAYGNYINKSFIKQGEAASVEVAIKGGKSDKIIPIAESNLSVIIPRQESELSVDYIIDENLKAPINKGQVVGKAVIKKGDEVMSSVNLVAQEAVEKANLWDYVKKITKK